jgi:serine phosphatase RsbU (regulator of sigma subunit)
VTDTRGEDGEIFCEERLIELLDESAALDADEVASRIDDALQAFEHGHQRDDVALLVLSAVTKPSVSRESAKPAEPSLRQ